MVKIMDFKYSDSNKRYHTLDYFYKHKFNSKVFKVSLNAGFTCPNIDGLVGTGGCIYCSKLGSGDFAGKVTDSLEKQFESVKNIISNKWPSSKYIAYFQAHTNTYAEVATLKKRYEPMLKLPNVIGLSIATRSDAISDECLAYLIDLSKRTYLTIELGLQTIHDKTSILINRCHTLDNFTQMVKKLRAHDINVVVHIINGLPYETKEMMLQTVKYLNTLDITGVKIHMLCVLKDTKLAKMYEQEKFSILSREEYVDIVCSQLEYLNADIVINRLTADPDPNDLITPNWIVKKFCVLNEIDKEMQRRNSYQGIKANN